MTFSAGRRRRPRLDRPQRKNAQAEIEKRKKYSAQEPGRQLRRRGGRQPRSSGPSPRKRKLSTCTEPAHQLRNEFFADSANDLRPTCVEGFEDSF